MILKTPFTPSYEDLPKSLPLLIFDDVLLLPGGEIPLNIFEEKYIHLIEDSLRADRMIGMVQPVPVHKRVQGGKISEIELTQNGYRRQDTYSLGCAGRITQFKETLDGRFLVTLTGLIRFDIVDDLPLTESGYQTAEINYEAYQNDMKTSPTPHIERQRLIDALKPYFKLQGMSADWKMIEQAPFSKLVTLLAMICPFTTEEKQALLESPDQNIRAEIMITLMSMACYSAEQNTAPLHH